MLIVGVVGTYPNKLAGNIIVINMDRATILVASIHEERPWHITVI